MTSWRRRPVHGLPGSVPLKRPAGIRNERRLLESSRTKTTPQVAPKTRSSITVPQNRGKRPAHSKARLTRIPFHHPAYPPRRRRTGSPLSKKGATYPAFAIQENSMLAVSRHFLSMFFH